MIKKVEWTQRAKDALDHYCNRIAQDSPTNAKKVRKEIVWASKMLSENPSLFQLDEYYPQNSGNIRRFFKWSYRIVYQVTDDKVIILNVYHTSSQPDQ